MQSARTCSAGCPFYILYDVLIDECSSEPPKRREERERRTFNLLSHVISSYLFCGVPFHVVLYQLVLFHVVVYQRLPFLVVLYQLVLFHMVVYQLMSFRVVLYQYMSFHVVLYKHLSFHVDLYQLRPFDVVLFLLIPFNVLYQCMSFMCSYIHVMFYQLVLLPRGLISTYVLPRGLFTIS